MLSIFDGKDATLISGITDYTWLQLLSETGRDLTPGVYTYFIQVTHENGEFKELQGNVTLVR